MIGFSKATVKSVQRGVYSGAGGTVTITSVDVTKAVVMCMSKSSSGYVAATGNAAGSLNYGTGVYPATASCCYNGNNWYWHCSISSVCPISTCTFYGCIPSLSLTHSGGSTCLTAKQFSAVLTNATTLTCDGPVEWQVVEYN